MQAETLILRGGRVVCPSSQLDQITDVTIRDGSIVSVGPSEEVGRVIDCTGLVVSHGFTDIGAELGDPGYLWREDLSTGSEAGAAGGFTTIVASPNTDPVVDNPVAVADMVSRTSRLTGARVLVSGAITCGLEGQKMAELGTMLHAGAVVLSDGRKTMMHTGLLRRALDYARPFDATVVMRPGDTDLEAAGVMHEGLVSTEIGLRGIPAAAEQIGVARFVELAQLTGCKVHLSQITTEGSIRRVAAAKQDGVHVTTAVPARNLVLTDRALDESVYDTAMRLLPPLRSESDRLACIAAVKSGVIDCVTADHVPMSRIEKEMEFMLATPGAMGLETALGSALEGLDGDIHSAVRALAVAPAAVLGRRAALEAGAVADVVVFDPDSRQQVAGAFRSRGTNEPMLGRTLPGKIVTTIRDGCIIYGPKSN